MPQFKRRAEAPLAAGGYRAYRSYVREDFQRRCGYCLLAELLAGGEENFELDHFRPRSRFPDLVNDFFNLYYSCHPCNWTKRDAWPPKELEARGIGFVDFCRDEFGTHFSMAADGRLQGKTTSGRYTVDAVRLNRRHLLVIRRLLGELGWAVHEADLDDSALRELLKPM